jgi:endonuclease/exonuclease/phosphatase family metal-dependent hydrolase
MRRLSPQILYTLEAALVVTFFVQALRFAIGTIYTRVAGAAALANLSDPSLVPPGTPGALPQDVVANELTFLLLMLVLPLLAVLLGRARLLMLVAVAVTALGRLLMNLGDFSPALAVSIALGGGLLYLALLIRHRARTLPAGFVLALGVDQLLRAAGDTLDPSWAAEYVIVQAILSAAVVLIALVALGVQRRADFEASSTGAPPPDRGMLPFWGGVSLGGLLFLELALLTMPNAIAGRGRTEYAAFVPATLAATLLPLVPWVRARARDFIALFDQAARGWVWMLLIALLIVLGTRLEGVLAGAAFVGAQFLCSLLFWYVARPQPDSLRPGYIHLAGLWMIAAAAVFVLLLTGDYFTYEYAFVRPFGGDFAFLDPIVLPLLRGFRGLGLGVLLLAVFFSALPMTQTLRRIPWQGGSQTANLLALAIIIVATAGSATLARPRQIAGLQNAESMRIGTYNIHAGRSEFYATDLPQIAEIIARSGADVVLMQEVEAGRLTSFGVDQSLWLARRIGMDRRFYATNEGLQGLAVLSRVPVALADGIPLTSQYQQTGGQRVQISPRPEASITLYNTWLGVLTAAEEDTLGVQEQDQQRQFDELLTWVASHNLGGVQGRLVIGGTFHNVPDSPLADSMRAAGFIDPFAGLPLELSATLWRYDVPRVRFDYLWLRNLGRLEAGVIALSDGAQPSDHRMAVVAVNIGS